MFEILSMIVIGAITLMVVSIILLTIFNIVSYFDEDPNAVIAIGAVIGVFCLVSYFIGNLIVKSGVIG